FGRPYLIRWSLPPGWIGTNANVWWSPDDGVTWNPIAGGVTSTSASWTPPHEATTTARVRVMISDIKGYCAIDASDGVFSLVDATTEVAAAPPSVRALFQNVPNPFNPSTRIGFDLPHAAVVQLDVYDVAGKHLRELTQAQWNAGHHEVEWDGRDDRGRQLSTGIYFYRMRSEDFLQTRRMMLVK